MAWFPYATKDDVPAHVAEELDDVETALRSASYRVRDALKTARFEVTEAGKPADTDVADAIRDATLAQVAFIAETGDETGAGAQMGGGSILSVSLPGGGGALDARAKQEARTAPAVDEILRSCDGIAWEVQYS
ncbi:hypothetical protein G3H63_09130 [Microbacterium resistens]|uniref:hypothetical protein n=1 Tax=Microbacterium resistens TaxID=156977 RepID=UPI001C587EED|nr:hypothetical protein [Microbacterium resistens]MBW1639233.1 hypothetical protein [Microbacterium resistens]